MIRDAYVDAQKRAGSDEVLVQVTRLVELPFQFVGELIVKAEAVEMSTAAKELLVVSVPT